MLLVNLRRVSEDINTTLIVLSNLNFLILELTVLIDPLINILLILFSVDFTN